MSMSRTRFFSDGNRVGCEFVFLVGGSVFSVSEMREMVKVTSSLVGVAWRFPR